MPHSTPMPMQESVASEAGRFSSLRSILGEWKQLFEGCNFMKRKERSRSRRKETKEPVKTQPRRVHSTSQVPSKSVRRSPSSSSDLCVCEAIDDQGRDDEVGSKPVNTPRVLVENIAEFFEMMEKFVALPRGIDQNEWIATHTLAMFDNANALCGTVSEFCTPVTCPVMSFPGTSKAHFVDEKGKRHAYSAMQYIDCVMSYCEKKGKDETFFPTRYGNKFALEFDVHCKRVAKLLWHCLGHLYTRHWDELDALNLRPQCGMIIAHLARLSQHFALLDVKDQQMINKTEQLVRPSPPPMQPDMLGSPPHLGHPIRVPSSKSGSWGGYPSPAILSCKSYAQTC